MQVTAERVAANRENARKSTGPVTPEGKAAVAKNAIKHGLLAKAVVVSTTNGTESQEEFDSLLADLVEELQPAGPLEESIVERIATCYWRLARAHRFESLALETNDQPFVPTDDLDRIRKRLADAQAELAQLDVKIALYAKPQETRTPEEAAKVTEWDKEWDKGPFEYLVHARMLPRHALYVTRKRPELETKVAEIAAELRAAEQRARSERVRHSLAGLLPEGRDLLNVVRYESMLDRQIHRALAELKRLRALGEDRPGPRRHLTRKDEETAS